MYCRTYSECHSKSIQIQIIHNIDFYDENRVKKKSVTIVFNKTFIEKSAN